MQVVRFYFLAIPLIFIACAKNENATKYNELGTFEMSRGKTKDGGCVIVGKCYDFESKEKLIPASLNVNGIVLNTDSGFFEYSVWEGNYNLKAGFIGKKWTLLKIKIEKGDSVFVKLYLKDDKSPLYQNQ